MLFAFEPVTGSAILLGLWMVGRTHLRSQLTLYGLQTLVLGLLAAWIGSQHGELALVVTGITVAVLKGIAVPIYLGQVIQRIGYRRDTGLRLAPPVLLLLTLGALGMLLLLQPFQPDIALSALPAVALIMIGMVLMVSRRLAVSQILGFLVLENGIFFYTVSQPHAMPLVVELGVLMDVLVGTMLAGVLVFRIRDSFEHIDVTELKQLRG
jgi:hydrogenase-4 component E